MASGSGVEVTAWVKIGDGATIDYHLCEEGEVEFSIGGRAVFDLVTTERGLHNLVDCAQEALREVQSAAARHDEGIGLSRADAQRAEEYSCMPTSHRIPSLNGNDGCGPR